MREVVEARRKDPGADLWRLSDRERTLPVDRLRPTYSPSPMTCLPAYRAKQPPTATTPGSALTDTTGCVSRWPGRSPLPRAGTGTAGSRPCSGPTSRRRRSAGSWPRTVRRRTCRDDGATAPTRARPRRLLATSPTAISRLGCRTGNGPRASPGIKVRDGKGVPLAAGRLPRRQDRRVHGRFRSRHRARRQDARQGRGKGARRVRGKRARPEIPVGGRHVETLVGPVRPVPAVPAHAPPGGVRHQRHRIARLPAAQGQPQPRPVPQRPGRGQAVLAGNLRHRGQTQPQMRQRRQQNQAQKRGRLIEGHITTNWKQALARLAAAYPERMEPCL